MQPTRTQPVIEHNPPRGGRRVGRHQSGGPSQVQVTLVPGMPFKARVGTARTLAGLLMLGLAALNSGGCTPTVKVATDEPITINLNVNIKHEILVKVDKQLDSLFSEDSDLF